MLAVNLFKVPAPRSKRKGQNVANFSQLATTAAEWGEIKWRWRMGVGFRDRGEGCYAKPGREIKGGKKKKAELGR